MTTDLLLGDEAAAMGAIHAGIRGVFSYPGTPATEIFEYIEAQVRRHGESLEISAKWSANEKVAYEEALGMSYAGSRALVAMKHVGLNVAADPFINSAITGVNGGLVVLVADDPGMHSSQNEQDTRYYHEFAQIPLLEPSNQQEAYDHVLEAFDYSEKIGLPVIVRMVTRLCHSRANVHLHEGKAEPAVIAAVPSNGTTGANHDGLSRARLPLQDPNDWVLIPVNARRRYRRLLSMQPQLLDDAEHSRSNRLHLAGPRGIIAAGLAQNYVAEALAGRDDDSLLHIGHYPLPVAMIRQLVDHCDEIVIVEDGYPYIERRLNGLLGLPGKAIRGKLTGDLPLDGELTPDSVAAALGTSLANPTTPLAGLAARPPQLCRGCPHSDSFRALVEATATFHEPILFSDIGCYALGALPPFRAVHSCVDMGSSISMAHGAAQAGVHPVVCTIGDSTFTHSGMTGLIGAVASDANMTVIVLDNSAVGMTGAQDPMTCGPQLVDIIRGLGVDPDHLHVLEPVPRKHAENVEVIKREVEHRGLSVIIPQRACIHLKRKPSPAAATA